MSIVPRHRAAALDPLTVAITAVPNQADQTPIVLESTVSGGKPPYTYSWIASGPDGASGGFSSSTVAGPTWTSPALGDWILALAVTDANGQVATDLEYVQTGGALDAVEWNVIDLTDGDLTFSDPFPLLSTSPTYVAGVNKIVFTALSAHADHAINVTANFDGPRWSTPLVDNSGVAVTSDDYGFLLLEIEHVTPVAKGPIRVTLGIAEAPSSTVLSTMKYGGIAISYASSSGNPILEVMAATAVTTVAAGNANNRVIRGSIQLHPGEQPGVSGVGFNASGGLPGGTPHQAYVGGTYTYTASTALHLMVAAALYNNSVTTTGTPDFQCKLRWRFVRLADDPSAS